MKRVLPFLLVFFAALSFPMRAHAQAHFRAGVGGEAGALVAAGTWGPNDTALMLGLTGKVGVGFPMGARWRGAVYWDPAIQALASPNRLGGFWQLWQQVTFEASKNRGKFAGGAGFTVLCASSCDGYPVGFGLVARAAYELLKGEHNALSLGLEARFGFGGRGRAFFDTPFWVTPALVVSWEYE